jgi:CheY-like chemotaxis protein
MMKIYASYRLTYHGDTALINNQGDPSLKTLSLASIPRRLRLASQECFTYADLPRTPRLGWDLFLSVILVKTEVATWGSCEIRTYGRPPKPIIRAVKALSDGFGLNMYLDEQFALWYFASIGQKPDEIIGRNAMAESVLSHKKMLIVDDEPDILAAAEAEILLSCSDCEIDKATSYEDAADLLKTKEYDLVILDIMGVRGFDLLELAVTRKLRVAMLTAHALSPEALKKSHDMGAMAYLPKNKLGELAPFLEDILQSDYKSGWKRVLDRLGDFFDKEFEPGWRKKVGVPNWY